MINIGLDLNNKAALCRVVAHDNSADFKVQTQDACATDYQRCPPHPSTSAAISPSPSLKRRSRALVKSAHECFAPRSHDFGARRCLWPARAATSIRTFSLSP